MCENTLACCTDYNVVSHRLLKKKKVLYSVGPRMKLCISVGFEPSASTWPVQLVVLLCGFVDTLALNLKYVVIFVAQFTKHNKKINACEWVIFCDTVQLNR